jgi:hypothetical protein
LMTVGSLSATKAFALRGAFGGSIDEVIPSRMSTAPNYWCTWSMQNSLYGRGAASIDANVLEGEAGASLARKAMNEDVIFGPNGWASVLYPSGRKELYFLLDDGWEDGGTASCILDQTKFPSFSGSPSERLRKLNEALRKSGWRGLALWLRDTPGGEGDRRLVSWSKEAQVGYWKIDGGDASLSANRARDELKAPLVIEHVHGDPPLNGGWDTRGRFGPQSWGSARIEIIRHSDVYRTYDTTAHLSIPSTIDRLSELFRGAAGHPEIGCLLNAEDEAYIAAVLGCTMGVMRFPLYGAQRPAGIEEKLEGPRRLNRCTEEIVRAIRWQRLAAPYGAGIGSVSVDEDILTDDWLFQHGETWYTESIGRRVKQGAPARFSRNIPLPEVSAAGEKPFVFAASFPNGAAALGSHGRLSSTAGWSNPLADVVWPVAGCAGPFGVFGSFKSVRMRFNKPLGSKRLVAQGLSGTHPRDITRLVHIRGPDVTLPGDLLEEIGRGGTPPGDWSAPALVIATR